jgi:hypothetical protein
MTGPVGLDGVEVCLDDERVVSDAGIALVATLAQRLGIERLVERFVRLRRGGTASTVVWAVVVDAFWTATGLLYAGACSCRARRVRRQPCSAPAVVAAKQLPPRSQCT